MYVRFVRFLHSSVLIFLRKKVNKNRFKETKLTIRTKILSINKFFFYIRCEKLKFIAKKRGIVISGDLIDRGKNCPVCFIQFSIISPTRTKL